MVAPEAPRVSQTLRLPESKLESLRDWATDGSGMTASAHVRGPNGRIALIKNNWTDGWFLPGGEVGVDESPPNAACREVREETGLKASIEESLVVLDQTYISEEDGSEWFSALFVVYAARADGEIPDASKLGVAADEILSARWFDSLPDNFHDGDLLRSYL